MSNIGQSLTALVYECYGVTLLLTCLIIFQSYGLWDRKDLEPVEKPQKEKENETEIQLSEDPDPKGSTSSLLRRRRRGESQTSESDKGGHLHGMVFIPLYKMVLY